MKEILLNKMYAGTYLTDNIGHEIINLFKSDNGKNYIYISPHGRIAKKHKEIETIILVRGINKRTVEIIAKAEGLTPVLNNSLNQNTSRDLQTKYIDENKITYGKEKPYNIFRNNRSNERDSVVYISFEAKRVIYPKEKTYITTDEVTHFEGNQIKLEGKQVFGTSLLRYFEENEENYYNIKKALDEDSIWEKKNSTMPVETSKTKTESQKKTTFLSLIKKEYDELCYSNLLAYFLENNKTLFDKFMEELLGIKPGSYYTIAREENNIDILIEDDKNIVVIENKIKSGINGKDHDIYGTKIQSQLSKYHKYATEKAKGRKESFYLFSPDYNKIDLRNYKNAEDYKVIPYSKLYDFFKNQEINDKYYEDFLNALSIHAREIDNFNFEIMQERFIQAIKSTK